MTNIDPSVLVGAMDGPGIVVPTSLIMHLGLEAVVFLQQAAYLTARSKKKSGWLNLRAV